MQLTLSPSLFENFGDIRYEGTCQFSQRYIRNISNDEDADIVFKNYCSSILSFGTDFNILEFHNLVFHLTNKNPMKVASLVVEVFDEATKQLWEKISQKTSNGLFTLQLFVEYYNDYLTNSLSLSRYLSYFDTKVLLNGQNKYSYVGLVRKYMFYRNIINTVYEYRDNSEQTSYYMYEILRKLIETTNMVQEDNMNIIKQLFNMYSFYNRMSYTPKKNKQELFNTNIDKLFLESLGSNPEFVKTIVYYIHNNIIQLKSTDKQGLENISNLIHMISSYFTERDMFNMYYEKLLEMRLLSDNYSNSSVEIELKLINSFTRPKDNRLIQNMLCKLEDMQKSLADDIILHSKIEIKVSDKKYKDKIDIDKINLKILNTKVFRNYAWSYSRIDNNENDNMTVPFDVAPYIDIYTQYYKIKYPYRELVWNFTFGTGVIKIKLGQKYYNLQVNTPQMFVLLQFNEKDKMTASDLSINLGLPVSKLGKVLNSLLKAKILKRESDKLANDPSMNIFLNPDFYYEKDNISLISIMDGSTQPKKQTVDPPTDKLTLVKTSILTELQKHKQVSSEELLNYVKSSLPFPLLEPQFKMCIEICKAEGNIKTENNILHYVE